MGSLAGWLSFPLLLLLRWLLLLLPCFSPLAGWLGYTRPGTETGSWARVLAICKP